MMVRMVGVEHLSVLDSQFRHSMYIPATNNEQLTKWELLGSGKVKSNETNGIEGLSRWKYTDDSPGMKEWSKMFGVQTLERAYKYTWWANAIGEFSGSSSTHPEYDLCPDVVAALGVT